MLKLKLQYFGHLMWRLDSLEKILMLGKIKGQKRRGWQRIKWLDSITNSIDMNLSKLQETVEDRGAWHAVVHEIPKSRTWLINWTITTLTTRHQGSDDIQPSHPLLAPYSPAFNLSQHQGLFYWISSSHQVDQVLEVQLQHQSFQWFFGVDFFLVIFFPLFYFFSDLFVI